MAYLSPTTKTKEDKRRERKTASDKEIKALQNVLKSTREFDRKDQIRIIQTAITLVDDED